MWEKIEISDLNSSNILELEQIDENMKLNISSKEKNYFRNIIRGLRIIMILKVERFNY